MKEKIIKAVIGILFIISLMFGEYRYIMTNIRPYINNNEIIIIYLEIFGQVDEYHIE